MKKKIFSPLTLVAALAIGLSGLAFSKLDQASDGTAKVTPVQVTVDSKPIARQGPSVTSFAPVVKKVTPSVAQVTVSTKPKKIPSMGSPFGDNPWFRQFFGEDLEHNFRTPRQQGLGSAVVVSKDGYLLTNNHVVDNADEVKVTLNDGREFNAKVVGKDSKTDVAVLKIDAKDLRALPIADSEKIEVGDLVLAVGNPFGVGQTVTMGMVSAVGRGNLGLDYEDFIQTDAAINPGNSGGALVDAEGRLIGINTAILSRSGGNQGIGFAVPANLARSVMDGLIKDGRVVRGFMGVNIQNLNPALAKEFGLKDETSGVLVSDVTAKSPAEKAGIKTGDVILEFNGKPVRDSQHLKLHVAQTAPGETVPVKVLRDGKTRTLQVAVKELPGSEVASKTKNPDNDSGDSLHGVMVGDLNGAAREQFKIPGTVKGVIVMGVEPDSAAYE
ncbi:MAG TPA: Do family serine endopeptidase, partial [Verrucomicrobiae bacterium]|nr:Do family serine endopeptidase [Verrucomicrobiae bacterium]